MAQKFPESEGAAWQDLYSAALLELDPGKLEKRIDEVERAIATRYQNLDPACDVEEALQLINATRKLSVLRREAK
jgi:hypothetical protein